MCFFVRGLKRKILNFNYSTCTCKDYCFLCFQAFRLYIQGFSILLQKAFRVGMNTPLDDRVFAMQQCKSLPVGQLIKTLYPDLYPIHGIQSFVSLLYSLNRLWSVVLKQFEIYVLLSVVIMIFSTVCIGWPCVNMLGKHFKISVFSSPELKAQVSFSDHLSSVVCRSVCL